MDPTSCSVVDLLCLFLRILGSFDFSLRFFLFFSFIIWKIFFLNRQLHCNFQEWRKACEWSSSQNLGVCQVLAFSFSFCFFLYFHFSWREGQGTGLSTIPTASLCKPVHIYSLAASTCEGAAWNTKGVCGYGCVGALLGSPVGPGRLPNLYTPLGGTEAPSHLSTTLGGFPGCSLNAAALGCHCRMRRWKDTEGAYSVWHLLVFTLLLMTKASFHLRFYSCLFSVLWLFCWIHRQCIT